MNESLFNQKKSASLYFISKMLKGAHLPNVYLNGVLVKQVNSVKYLGHFVTCELSDDIGRVHTCSGSRSSPVPVPFHSFVLRSHLQKLTGSVPVAGL